VFVGINGLMIYARYDQRCDGIASTQLAEHLRGDGLALPVNAMFVDAEGNAYPTKIAAGSRQARRR